MGTSLGQTIATSRRAKGLWQWRLAEMIDIEQAMLSRIEAGQVMPGTTTLEKISAILDIPPDELRGKAAEIVETMAKCPRFRRRSGLRGPSLN